jgi:hypothetical protein
VRGRPLRRYLKRPERAVERLDPDIEDAATVTDEPLCLERGFDADCVVDEQLRELVQLLPPCPLATTS